VYNFVKKGLVLCDALVRVTQLELRVPPERFLRPEYTAVSRAPAGFLAACRAPPCQATRP
jgi:hypothetical protein